MLTLTIKFLVLGGRDCCTDKQCKQKCFIKDIFLMVTTIANNVRLKSRGVTSNKLTETFN